MDTSKLQPGDRIEANVRGQRFTATITNRHPHQGFGIEPDDPKHVTYRFVKFSQVAERLDQKERLGVGG